VSEDVYFEIRSVATIQTEDRLAALGRVVDRFPEFAPTKMGPRDPPRTPTPSVEQQLRDWAPTIRPGDYFNQFMVRRDPRTHGLLWVTGDIWNYPPIGAHELDFGVDEDWFAGPDRSARLERFADLFRAACESMDAMWGGAGLTSFRRQKNDFVDRAHVEGTLFFPGMPGTGWDLRERALPDLYWLNYFGPAYLDMWGDALGGLGDRQQPTANGGLVVWTTETPFVFDGGAQRLTDYAWKRPFYDALGWDTIIHENWTDPGVGVRVPSYQDHRRFTAKG
jgi:hypothetical protein